MNAKTFLLSDAGIGTAGVILTCLIIVFPVIGSWMVAGVTLVFALRHLLKSFGRLDGAGDEGEDAAGPEAGPEHAEAPHFDVEAAMAEMTARAARTAGRAR